MTTTEMVAKESLVDEFRRDCELRDLSEVTVSKYVASVRVFTEALGRKGRDVLNPDVNALKDFLVYLRYERRQKAKTIENQFSGISAFYDYLVYSGKATSNIVPSFRKRYLRRYKDEDEETEKRSLTVQEMSRLVHCILDPRDKAIAVLLAKTGVRRGELLRVDVGDIDWTDYSILLKPARKRSNKTVFFDDEAAMVLRRWLKVRETLDVHTPALFVSLPEREQVRPERSLRRHDEVREEVGIPQPEILSAGGPLLAPQLPALVHDLDASEWDAAGDGQGTAGRQTEERGDRYLSAPRPGRAQANLPGVHPQTGALNVNMGRAVVLKDFLRLRHY